MKSKINWISTPDSHKVNLIVFITYISFMYIYLGCQDACFVICSMFLFPLFLFPPVSSECCYAQRLLLHFFYL